MNARRGYTLIETVLALGVMAILAGALGSVLLIAVRAIPSGQAARGSTSPTAAAGGALDLLASELRFATAIASGTTTAIEFTTPDRDGDGSADTLRYEWGGDAGDPLTRRVNSGAASNVVPGVQAFALNYTWREEMTTTKGRLNSGASTMLCSYDTGSPSPFSLNTVTGVGMTLKPVLPMDAVAYSITKVWVKMRSGNTAGSPKFDLVIYAVDAQGKPTSTVLASRTSIDAGNLSSSMEWYEAELSVPALAPSSGFAVTVIGRSGSESGGVGTFSTGSLSPGEGLVTTTNAGTSWSISTTSAMCVRVQGTVITRDQTTSTTRTLERVDLHIQTSDAGAQAVDVSALTRNRPVLP